MSMYLFYRSLMPTCLPDHRSGHSDGGIDLKLMDQYLSLFTGRCAARVLDDNFDAVGALMLDSPGELKCWLRAHLCNIM